jgi:hypothetical protein
MALEYVLYGNQFYPMGVDAWVTPLLDDSQKKVWQGAQKVGMVWGFGGVWSALMNDNDALEEELGEVKKAEPPQAVPAPPDVREVRLRGVVKDQMKRFEAKKAVAGEAIPKK